MELTWSKDNTPFADLRQVLTSNASVKCKGCGVSISVDGKDGTAIVPSEFHSEHAAHGGRYELDWTHATGEELIVGWSEDR